MSKLIPRGLAVLMLLAGCGEDGGMRDLVIGVEGEFPPWCMIDRRNGEYSGFDVDLATAACARLGYRPVFKTLVWAEKEKLLAAHEIDCLWCGFTLRGRENDYAILGPYMTSHYVFVARRDSGFAGYRDLEGRVFGCQSGSTAEELLRRNQERRDEDFPQAGRIIGSRFVEACMKQLETGIVETALFDVDYAEWIVRSSKGRLMIVPGAHLGEDSVGVGFRREDTALRNRFGGALDELVRTNRIRPLLEKYFGSCDRWCWKSARRETATGGPSS